MSDKTALPPLRVSLSDADWARILDCSPELARKALDNLVAKGLIEEVPSDAR